MNKYINRIKRFFFNPKIRFMYLAKLGFWNKMSDEAYLKKLYFLTFNQTLNLEQPKTFNEKMQWLKIYDRSSLYTIMVDKYKVREFIGSIIGNKYLIPLIGVWDDPDDIDFDLLPDQFVLKCNHNSGLGLCICKDKRNLNINKVKSELRKGLKENYYIYRREWPYKNVPRKIICEEYVQDKDYDVLPVFKVFCFNGIAKIIQFIKNDTKEDETVDYYDREWNKLNLKQDYPNSIGTDIKPAKLSDMLELAEIVSKGMDFLRVDFYLVNGELKFSECTFYSDAGFGIFHPSEWDDILGSWIQLHIH